MMQNKFFHFFTNCAGRDGLESDVLKFSENNRA